MRRMKTKKDKKHELLLTFVEHATGKNRQRMPWWRRVLMILG